jgi:hypothetical protein
VPFGTIAMTPTLEKSTPCASELVAVIGEHVAGERYSYASNAGW